MKCNFLTVVPVIACLVVSGLTAEPGIGDSRKVELTREICIELVMVPPGEFSLGSTRQEREWASGPEGQGNPEDFIREGNTPLHSTVKSEFWMGKTEVTIGQWKIFVDEAKYITDGEKDGRIWGPRRDGNDWSFLEGRSWRDPNFGFIPDKDHPVAAISWNDAVEFCRWLTCREKEAGRLPEGYEFRLPSEAEWEYACRGGSLDTCFWWGEEWSAGTGRLNRKGSDDGFEYVSPVAWYGQEGENGYGLSDMLGNVYEWCLDGYDEISAHSEVYRGNPDMRVIKGGSYRSPHGYQRPAFRSPWKPSTACALIGFRVVLGLRQL